MKRIFLIFVLAICGAIASAVAQPLKALMFATNGQVVANTGTNVLTFTNDVKFGNGDLTDVTASLFKAKDAAPMTEIDYVIEPGGIGGTIDLRSRDADTDGSANGGDITMRGGKRGSRSGNINLSGDAFGLDSRGGDIDLRAGSNGTGNARGGDLLMRGSIDHSAGSINTSASDENGNGGSINTSDGGGSIITYSGGGSIDTRTNGRIEFGFDGTRTTVIGTATSNRSISLPNASGTLALLTWSGMTNTDAAGFQSALFSATTTNAPTNTNAPTPNAWLDVRVGTNTYKLGLWK